MRLSGLWVRIHTRSHRALAFALLPNLVLEPKQTHLLFNYYRLVIPRGPVVDKYAPKLKEVLNETSKSVFRKV
jgi:hypothetical protein